MTEPSHFCQLDLMTDCDGKDARIILEGIDITRAVRRLSVDMGVGELTSASIELLVQVSTLEPDAVERFRVADVLRIRDELQGKPAKRGKTWLRSKILKVL